ncbi:MAG: right-handed parallel beta-helix repeat-containing protein [Fimbriimonadaceae bacterium]|nr:right-handed parallel beta-helix repeat-containing protein [Fimbriimonadaceae bacterium]
MAWPRTLTVGPSQADLPGYHRLAIQAAVDYVAAQGGGVVHLLAGRYELRGPVQLRSGVWLVGDGDDTHLVKAPVHATRLAADADWFDDVIEVADASGFRVGDGVILEGEPYGGGYAALNKEKRLVAGIDGHRLLLDRTVVKDYYTELEVTVSSLFPLVWIEQQHDCGVADLRLDGNRDQNTLLDGNHAGCIFMQYATRVEIRNVTAHHYFGDGFSWQVCPDVQVLDCRTHDHANLGLHPGSGSLRPTIRGCQSHHNEVGLFFCWGVADGLAEGNTLRDNRHWGIDIGHRDVRNLIRGNTIRCNGLAGVRFRSEPREHWLPHDNTLLDNHLQDNGGAGDGLAIWLQDKVNGTVLRGNRITDSGLGVTRTGVRIEPQVGTVELDDNRFEGIATPVDDRRPAS